jgi:hypothetical protein
VVSKINTSGSRRITHPAALWGIFGFVLILCQAVYRLAPLAWQPIAAGDLETWQWALYGFSILFNAYSEGYRAFQLQVAPRVVARADHLASQPKFWHVLFAPLFCMALFHASRRRLIVAWAVYAGIVVIVIFVKRLSQPWRGMIDAGVVVGLSWGIIAIIAAFVARMRGGALQSSADLPDGVEAAA